MACDPAAVGGAPEGVAGVQREAVHGGGGAEHHEAACGRES